MSDATRLRILISDTARASLGARLAQAMGDRPHVLVPGGELALIQRGVRLTTSPGANAGVVAQTALAGILSLAPILMALPTSPCGTVAAVAACKCHRHAAQRGLLGWQCGQGGADVSGQPEAVAQR